MVMLLLVATGVVRAQGFRLEGMESQPLPVTVHKMTNVIFPVDVAAGVRVSRDILAQKVHGVENVIELKALKRDIAQTNLSVYGKDGRLYSFVLHYVEDTSVLDYRVVREGDLPAVRLTGWPVAPATLKADAAVLGGCKGFLHRRAKEDGMRLTLTGVYWRDSLLWLSFALRDRTVMGINSGRLRMYVEDRVPVKRVATQEVEVEPVDADAPGKRFVVGLRPMVVKKGKRLVIVVGDGEREVRLKVKGKVLLGARREE